MAKVYELRTFKDIQDAIREELGIPETDTTMLNRIKRDINAVYLYEVVPFANWWWARGNIDVQQDPFINAGTVTVTQGATAITFTSAPAASQVGSQFSLNDESEIYTISEHVAGATAAQLTVRYTGTTNAEGSYRLWRRAIALPADCRETFEVRHSFRNTPLEGVGIQELRRIEVTAPFVEHRPIYYSTTDFKDPDPFDSITSLPAISTRASAGYLKSIKFASSLRTDTTDTDTRLIDVGDRLRINASGNFTYNGDYIVATVSTTTNTDDTIQYVAKTVLSESAVADATMTIGKENGQTAHRQYRELLVYPSAFNERTTLHVDYIKNPEALVTDADEPIIPIEDRLVLVLGTLARGWVKARNEATASINIQLFRERLGRMKGDLQDSTDQARLMVNKRYLATKRATLRKQAATDRIEFGIGGGAGGSGTTTGTASTVATFNSSGELIGSALVSVTELEFLNGVLSQLAGNTDTATLTNKTMTSAANTFTIDADVSTVSNIKNAEIKAAAAIALNKLAALTATIIPITDASGFLVSSAITPTELTYLNDFVPLTSVSLNDNQSSVANVFTYTAASFEASIVEYSIARGSGIREVGRLMIATDGSSVNMTQDTSTLGTTGVVLSADIDSGSVRVRYTSTSTGTAPSFKFIHRRWDI